MPPRPAPLTPPIPIGYLLLGMVLMVVAFGCAAVAISADDVLGHALFALIAMLSLALVEALWWMRPWVARAMDAWAAACVGAVLVAIFAGTAAMGLGPVFVLSAGALALVGLPCAVARWYVRDRAKRLGLLPGRVP